MKKKWIILLLICVLGATAFLWFPKSKKENGPQSKHLKEKGPYFEPVKIATFSSAHIPCVNVQIEDKSIISKVDLGFKGDFSLFLEPLNNLAEKSFVSSNSHYGIRGKKYNSDVYKIPEIKIGRMVFSHPRVKETNPNFEKDCSLFQAVDDPPECHQGRLGWELFYNVNLFLDFEQSKLAFCDSLETLKKQGYPVDSFIVTPLLLDHGLLEFDAITETGPLRCLLDTGCTYNMINIENDSSDQWNFNPKNTSEISVFKIAGKDFGHTVFRQIPINLPFKVEAIVGMEFLFSKLVFIDFPNRKIYFCDSKNRQDQEVGQLNPNPKIVPIND